MAREAGTGAEVWKPSPWEARRLSVLTLPGPPGLTSRLGLGPSPDGSAGTGADWTSPAPTGAHASWGPPSAWWWDPGRGASGIGVCARFPSPSTLFLLLAVAGSGASLPWSPGSTALAATARRAKAPSWYLSLGAGLLGTQGNKCSLGIKRKEKRKPPRRSETEHVDFQKRRCP